MYRSKQTAVVLHRIEVDIAYRIFSARVYRFAITIFPLIGGKKGANQADTMTE